MTKSLVLLTGLVLSTLASAAPRKVETWRGSGEIRSLNNEILQTYKLQVVREQQDDGNVKQSVEVLDGSSNRIWQDQCEITGRTPGSWKKTCSKTAGGGFMMNHGIGQDYVSDKDGRAYSTTIVFDGADRMRLHRVELLNGKAQRLFVETLQK